MLEAGLSPGGSPLVESGWGFCQALTAGLTKSPARFHQRGATRGKSASSAIPGKLYLGERGIKQQNLAVWSNSRRTRTQAVTGGSMSPPTEHLARRGISGERELLCFFAWLAHVPLKLAERIRSSLPDERRAPEGLGAWGNPRSQLGSRRASKAKRSLLRFWRNACSNHK
jgi:hypothetical protein